MAPLWLLSSLGGYRRSHGHPLRIARPERRSLLRQAPTMLIDRPVPYVERHMIDVKRNGGNWGAAMLHLRRKPCAGGAGQRLTTPFLRMMFP